MITTVNGDYEATASPFMMKPWTWGYSGIGVDQSRDGKTLVIGTMPHSNVVTENLSFTYIQS